MIQEIDATQFSNCLRAERKGNNTLIMRRLDKPFKRFDGKTAQFELEHRWHKSEESDVNSVQGNDFTYWRKNEWDQNKRLFDQFSCTG